MRYVESDQTHPPSYADFGYIPTLLFDGSAVELEVVLTHHPADYPKALRLKDTQEQFSQKPVFFFFFFFTFSCIVPCVSPCSHSRSGPR